MKHIVRRFLSFVIVLCMLVSVSIGALAATYDLSEGSVTVNASESGQTVTHGTKEAVSDSDPVVTSSAVTDNTVTLSSSGDATVKVTFDGVDIVAENSSAVTVTDGSKAEITVEGENSVANVNYDTHAAVHVGSGELTITGNSSDDKLEVFSSGDSFVGGAAIGSDAGEDFTGSITIDSVQIEADSDTDGAGIGAGSVGDFNGSVTIQNADVSATSYFDGAGIGSGYEGDFNGSVTIKDSDVSSYSDLDGAGIGSGAEGDFSGSVSIENSEVEASSYYDGAGIGSGAYGDFSGSVTIKDGSEVYAYSGDDGAGIGSGQEGNVTSEAQITVTDSTVYAESEYEGNGIGSSDYCDFDGTITVSGSSELYLYDQYGDAPLGNGYDGSGNGTVILESGVKVYVWEYYEGDYYQVPPEEYSSVVNAKLATDGAGVPGVAQQQTFPQDTFWRDVVSQVRAAEKGATVTVDAGGRTYVPAYVLDAVGECGVTLVIQWNGGDDITVTKAYSGDKTYHYFALADLAELLK